MADPTAALHGAVKSESSNSATATLASDSGTVAVGDWLVALIGGAFGATGPTITYSIAKSAGTATVGAQVTPTSPGATVAQTANLDVGSGYRMRTQALYLPVTGAGTLTVTATRQAGTFDHGWIIHFIRVQNPNAVGAVGQVTDLTSSTSESVSLDAVPASNSLVLAFAFDNNGDTAITEPTGMTELGDNGVTAFGIHMESAKKETGGSQSMTFTNMAADVFGRAAIAFEVTSASLPPSPVGRLIAARQSIVRGSYY